MAQDLGNRYFIKRRFSDTWVDITTLFDGIKVLSITGMNEIGEAQNVFTQQWIDSQEEDYLLAGETIVRANVDLTMTFIAGTRYSSNGSVDTQTVYNSFVSYVCNDGDFYIKSTYRNVCACCLLKRHKANNGKASSWFKFIYHSNSNVALYKPT